MTLSRKTIQKRLPEDSSTNCCPHVANPSSCWRNLPDPFFQGYGHFVTHILPDRLANVCPNRQFMFAITQSHERTPKGVPIDFAPNLYQAAGFKELD
jgi:hypothetical protein